MRLTNHSLFALLAVVGCGVNDASDITSGSVIRIEPSTTTIVVENGVPVSQEYRVIATSPDGTERDVTADTKLTLARPELGQWHGSRAATSLEVRGTEVGQSAIVATYDGDKATAGITVYAHTRVVADDAAMADAPKLFDSVDPTFSCFPLIAYPEAGTILPSNLDGLDVQWVDSRDDVFEVSFETTYAQVQLYTTNLESTVGADAWAQLASSHEAISLRIAGISAGSPSVKCTSDKRRLYVTDKPLQGTLYSWADGLGIYRKDVATSGPAEHVSFLQTTSVETLSSYTPGPAIAQVPASCAGCAISRGGDLFAMSPDNADAAIYDFAHAQPIALSTWWSEATFSPRNKLVVVTDGVLRQLELDGTVVDELASSAGGTAMSPQFSSDGARLAYIESKPGSSEIMVREFADDGNTWSDAKVLVANVAGATTSSPSWSPDGRWLTFTRTSGSLTAIWIVKTDGSQAPVQLTVPTQDAEMAARWAMDEQTIGGQRFFYLTFDSLQQYGAHADLGRQIWMMAFFPETKLVRPAFHVPFQSPASSNHVSQWTETLVR